MKNLVIVFLLLVPFFSMADAWDNLTLDQANKVKSYLKKNPYILDYCDCCSSTGAYLVKVTKIEIVPCEWQKEDYSVKVTVKRIAQVPIEDKKMNVDNVTKTSGIDDFVISMNYTWILSDKNKKALPLYDAVSYDAYSDIKNGSGVCAEAAEYPLPQKVKDKKYKKWYKKRMK